MVTMAKRNTELQRATYLEIESSRMPQAIVALLPQVLARYSIAPEVPNQVEMEDREHEGEEDVHTLAATAM